jgi:hypothetical protein
MAPLSPILAERRRRRRRRRAALPLDTRIEELVAQGLSREAARARAVAEFGDVDAVRAGLVEIDRRADERRGRRARFDAFRQDLVFAVRALRRTPAVSLTIILTLALGVGANAAMFSLLDVIYLRAPASVADADAVRRVWSERSSRVGRSSGRASTTPATPPPPKRWRRAAVTLYQDPRSGSSRGERTRRR